MQHSRAGLLRSLLFEALKSRSELIRELFKAEWKEMAGAYAESKIFDSREWDFPIRRLEQVFNQLIQLASDNFKLSFFIDGLDEFKEEPEGLVCLVNEAARSPFVKICVSSRPWLVFEEAFGLGSSLRLQDLTYLDIQLYVREKLQQDPKMERLESSNPKGARSLVRSIVIKANSVFLWVRIVTKSLLDGLRNWDDISDLERRLDELPSDLNALYSHMLDRIEPLYFFQASRIFRIFDSASALDLRLTLLELDLAVTADYSMATAPTMIEPSYADLEFRCQRMDAHLKSRCGGLLEAHNILDRNWEAMPDGEPLELNPFYFQDGSPVVQEARGMRLRTSWKISYLHRTVKDFLNTPPDEPFDPYFSLLMSYIINLKQGLRSYYYDSEAGEESKIREIVTKFIQIAGKLNQSNRQVLHLLYDFRALVFQWFTNSEPEKDLEEWNEEFLLLTTFNGLWAFVGEMIQDPTQFLAKRCQRLLLQLALGDASSIDLKGAWSLNSLGYHRHRQFHRLTPTMVDLLLSRGSDPNAAVGNDDWTTWQGFLMHIYVGNRDQNPETYYPRCFDVIRSLLEYGADIGSCRREGKFLGLVTIDQVIDQIFSVRLLEKVDELRSLVQQKRASRKRKVLPDETPISGKRQET